jgi:N-acyl-D-amino-acid deacylase
VLWDPQLTPSSWHGVTTVIMGNCGFGIAPTRPEHRETIARTLENVEGMSAEALEAGIPWNFETFPEYLDAIDRCPKRINVAAMIGHTPLRLYVMGEEATERSATVEEVDKMRAIVAEALAAGAAGFATSKSPTHVGAGGKPVPSRLADIEEVFTVAGALGEAGHGVLQVTPGPGLFLEELSELSRRFGCPVTWTALLTGIGKPGTALALAERTAALGGEVWPQIACRPLVMQVTLEDPFPLAQLPSFQEVLAAARDERAGIYADPNWRERAAPEVERMWGRQWGKLSLEETDKHPELAGLSLPEVAKRLGTSPFGAMVDVSLDDGLRSRFRMVLLNDDEEEVAKLLADHRCVLGLSDAGAHASQLCDACFSTHLLSHWVRDRKVVSLEEAVWRLTGQPAQVFRLRQRGLIRPGYVADLVAFDPDAIGTQPAERVWDLPAGADRLVVRSTGIEHTWVAGVEGGTSGKLLRG